MSFQNGVVDKILRELGNVEVLADAKLRAGFPSDRKSNPIQNPYIVVEIVEFSAKNAVFGGYFGKIQGIDHFGTQEKMTVRVTMFAPVGMKPGLRDEIFSAVEHCVRTKNALEEVKVGPLSYARDVGAIQRSADFVLKGRYVLKSVAE